MIELSQFGTIIQKYTGSGQLTRNGDSPEECSFEVGQFSDGKIIAICSTAKDYFNAEDGEIALVGTTSERIRLFAIGRTIHKHTVNLSHERAAATQIILRSSGEFQLGLGNKDWQGQARIHFYITNFKFVGTHGEEIEPGHWRLNHSESILITKNSSYVK